MADQKPVTVEKSQLDKFRDLARELECDEDQKAFDERLKQIARSPKTPKEASKAD